MFGVSRIRRNLPSSQAAAGHPNLSFCEGSSGWESKTVPLALHGDGTPVAGIGKAWSRMLDIFSWTSLVAVGETLDYTFLIYAAFTQLLTKTSMDTAWRLITWSFNILRSGVWPEADAFGRRYNDFAPLSKDAARVGSLLAGGYRACLFVVRGDLDYYAHTLGLRSHTSSMPCSWCPCTSTPGDPMNWREFRKQVRFG